MRSTPASMVAQGWYLEAPKPLLPRRRGCACAVLPGSAEKFSDVAAALQFGDGSKPSPWPTPPVGLVAH